MAAFIDLVQQIDLMKIDETSFVRRYVGCLVLTQDRKILLQQRGDDWDRFPGFLATFGGAIEFGESPMEALVREMHEELGAEIIVTDVISLGAITEAITKHSELIYVYFWHDSYGTITGCYEGEAKYYDDVASILNHPKIMDDLRWLLSECQKRDLLYLDPK